MKQEFTIDIFGIIGGTPDEDKDPINTDVLINQQLATFSPEEHDGVRVRLNSIGGKTTHGAAIFNLLRTFAEKYNVRITTEVLGAAYSAASVIFMAGDTRIVHPGAKVMIHETMGAFFGNKRELRNEADNLEHFDDTLSKLYYERTNYQTPSFWLSLIEDPKGTWFDSEQALAYSIATEASLVNNGTTKDPVNQGSQFITEWEKDGQHLTECAKHMLKHLDNKKPSEPKPSPEHTKGLELLLVLSNFVDSLE